MTENRVVCEKLTEENFVQLADKAILSIINDRKLSTSQIRNILATISPIYNDVRLENNQDLSKDAIRRINYAKVKILYQAGRHPEVKSFVEKAHLLEYFQNINGKKDQFILFEQYLEALVAYHKYYGGAE